MQLTVKDRNLCMRAAKILREVADGWHTGLVEETEDKVRKAMKRRHEHLLAENERLKDLGRRIKAGLPVDETPQ